MGTVRPLDVEGYIAAPVLPLRDDGAIDLEGMARYVRWIADDRPKALVRIKSMTVEGDVEFPPEDSKFPPVNAFKEPEKKAPESKATTQPDTRATQPESR